MDLMKNYRLIFISYAYFVYPLCLLLAFYCVNLSEGAFYTLSSSLNHDFDFSLAFKHLPKAQKKHIQIHLLDFLGLDDVPSPLRKGKF